MIDTTEERTRMYLDYLEAERRSPFVDEDGDIAFWHRKRMHYIHVDERDEEYFQIVLPNFHQFNPVDTPRVERIAFQVTSRIKVGKVFRSSRRQLSASAEVLLAHPEDFRFIFHRLLSVIGGLVMATQRCIREPVGSKTSDSSLLN